MTPARRTAGSLAVAAALIAGTTVLVTSPASAEQTAPAAAPVQRPTALAGDIYLYYSASANSSFSRYFQDERDFAGDTFAAGGEGSGQRVKNNVNRAWNSDTGRIARIYYNENFNGSGSAPYDDFYPNQNRQLIPSVRNNNASMKWRPAG